MDRAYSCVHPIALGYDMSKKVDRIFSSIHNRYDLMNSVMSMGFDRVWRKRASAEVLSHKKVERVLDVACGTGEFSIMLAKQMKKAGRRISIEGIDMNAKMLSAGRVKIKGRYENIHLEVGDATNINRKSSSFDALTTAFAMRDFDSLERFAAESYRVLKKGGKIVALDMAEPDSRMQRLFFRCYSTMMKMEGMFVDKTAYDFLIESIHGFDKRRLAGILKAAGFRNVKIKNLETGIAFVATGTK